MPDNDLAGRRVIVTGGASGMGAALVGAFPYLGAAVVSLDVNDAGAKIADQVGADFISCDVSDQSSVTTAVSQAVEQLGGLDVLVHAAGIAPGSPAVDTSLTTWNDVMTVNATGTFLTNLAVYPHLAERGGRIINFASGAGVNGYPMKPAYAASKGAVLAWSRSIAVEWAPNAITVNCLAPAIWTPMYDKTRSEMTPEALAAHDGLLQARIPLGGRLGDPDHDLVPVVAFLASDASRFMTGQVFCVDGGMLMMR